MSGRNKVRFFFFLRGTSKRFFSLFSAFQGGAEHSVPVVISKIFKDQVGKRVFKKMPLFLICILDGKRSVQMASRSRLA